MKPKLFFFMLIIFGSIGKVSAQGNNEILKNLVSTAVEVSPRLKMLESKKRVASSRIEANSNLPDPILTFGLLNLPTNSFSFTQEPMTGKMIGLSQAVPFPGKLSTTANVLSKDTEITQEEINDSKNEIINNVKQAYYDLCFIREALKIAEKSKKNIERITAVVRTKYTVSEASQQDLIQADVELTKIKDKIAVLKGKEKVSLSTLNSYVLQNPETPIETESFSAIGSLNPKFNDLINIAKQNRPFLKGIELEKNKSELMENLAEYEYYPNFNFTVQYSQRDKIAASNTPLNDFVSFIVGLNLPINHGGKKTAKVQESRLLQQMYSDQYNTALQLLDKNIGEGLSKLKELREREELNSAGLLPQVKLSLKSALANYQVGNTEFINVLDAQNKVYEAEINISQIRMQYYKELARLEFLIGKSLTN